MKELSIKEKAERYDNEIKKVNDYYEGKTKLYSDVDKTLDYLFPELKESEDEKMFKQLRDFFKNHINNVYEEIDDSNEMFAWLEKQCKSTDILADAVLDSNKDGLIADTIRYKKQTEQKSELKFKIGDLITNGILVGEIDEIHELGYHAYFGDHYADVPDIENWHKWTIQDAKDGDVLSDGTTIFIFKDLLSDDSVMSYCDCDTDSGESDAFCAFSVNLMCSKITPVTKEQRDLLFKKMKEAGYEWNVEKKELRKTEQNPTNNQFTLEQASVLDKHIDTFLGQNPAWSEEDKKIIKNILSVLDVQVCWNGATGKKENPYQKEIDWFKSLKEIVQPQPKQEWSEEDEMIYQHCKTILHDYGYDNWLKSLRSKKYVGYNPYKATVESIAEMCKHYDKASHNNLRDFYDNVKVKCKDAKEYDSLYPQNTWKPSEYYLGSLVDAIIHYENIGIRANGLKELLEELKKLKGE